eukprot:2441896-Alexandrium_andersonii.AAC.1
MLLPCVLGTCRPCTRRWALARPFLTLGWWTQLGGLPSGGRALSYPPSRTQSGRPTPLPAPLPGTAGGDPPSTALSRP